MFFGLAILVSLLSAHAEPKAYDLVKYRGKADSLTIAFDFADGYPEASEIRITEAGGHKSKRLVLDGSGEMHFVPENDRSTGVGVTLKMSADEAAPEKIIGIYRVGAQTILFQLTRR